VRWKTDGFRFGLYDAKMNETKQRKMRVIEVAILGCDVLVTFADGRVAMLDADDIYQESTEPPPDPDDE